MTILPSVLTDGRIGKVKINGFSQIHLIYIINKCIVNYYIFAADLLLGFFYTPYL